MLTAGRRQRGPKISFGVGRHKRVVRKTSSMLSDFSNHDEDDKTLSLREEDPLQSKCAPTLASASEQDQERESNNCGLAGVEACSDQSSRGSGVLDADRLDDCPSALEAQLRQRTFPTLSREEVQVGALLGEGAFSVVHEVKGLKLKIDSAAVHSNEMQELRKDLVQSVYKEEVMYHGRATDASYAIKFLRRGLVKTPKGFYQAALDLSREIAIMSRLEHPHILSIRAVSRGGTAIFAETGHFDSYFVVTDRLSDTLQQRIKEWRTSPAYHTMETTPKTIMKTQYMHQLALALAFLHEKRICYRDLKTENIGFLDSACQPLQLFDFGLARILPPVVDGNENATYHMSIAGTTRYMAPEIMSNGRYNLKVDVHSYAMVCYEMLAEGKAFPTLSIDSMYDFVYKRGIRPHLSHLDAPKALKEMITQSWCPNHEDRRSMQDICESVPLILTELEDHLHEMENAAEC